MENNYTTHNFNYLWNLKDTIFTKDKGKVFSCFAGGGGSTMGYKLAGFDVIGCNEIDKKMMQAYISNHNPKYAFLEGIQTFKERSALPEELYNLDILDGSPPCSTFSMAGKREKTWGVEKKFKEGQIKQILDTLFFDFIELAKKLQPKIVIAENVKGLLQGKAKLYVEKIYQDFDQAGYICQHFLLDASKMGVPQKRERVFFIALRKDLQQHLPSNNNVPSLDLSFNEKTILFKEFYQKGIGKKKLEEGQTYNIWSMRKEGDKCLAKIAMRETGKRKYFNNRLLCQNNTPATLTAQSNSFYLYDEYRSPNKHEYCCISSFPQDYNFEGVQPYYLAGMSVPPIMTAQIAKQIHTQWLSKLP